MPVSVFENEGNQGGAAAKGRHGQRCGAGARGRDGCARRPRAAASRRMTWGKGCGSRSRVRTRRAAVERCRRHAGQAREGAALNRRSDRRAIEVMTVDGRRGYGQPVVVIVLLAAEWIQIERRGQPLVRHVVRRRADVLERGVGAERAVGAEHRVHAARRGRARRRTARRLRRRLCWCRQAAQQQRRDERDETPVAQRGLQKATPEN